MEKSPILAGVVHWLCQGINCHPKVIPSDTKHDLFDQSLHMAYHCILFMPPLSQLTIMGPLNNHYAPSLMTNNDRSPFYVLHLFLDTMKVVERVGLVPRGLRRLAYGEVVYRSGGQSATWSARVGL